MRKAVDLKARGRLKAPSMRLELWPSRSSRRLEGWTVTSVFRNPRVEAWAWQASASLASLELVRELRVDGALTVLLT